MHDPDLSGILKLVPFTPDPISLLRTALQMQQSTHDPVCPPLKCKNRARHLAGTWPAIELLGRVAGGVHELADEIIKTTCHNP